MRKSISPAFVLEGSKWQVRFQLGTEPITSAPREHHTSASTPRKRGSSRRGGFQAGGVTPGQQKRPPLTAASWSCFFWAETLRTGLSWL